MSTKLQETQFLNKMMRSRRNARGCNLAPIIFHVSQLNYNSTCLTFNLPLSLQCHTICKQKSDIHTQKNSCLQKIQKNLHRSSCCQQSWDSNLVDLPNADNGVLMKHAQIQRFLGIESGNCIEYYRMYGETSKYELVKDKHEIINLTQATTNKNFDCHQGQGRPLLWAWLCVAGRRRGCWATCGQHCCCRWRRGRTTALPSLCLGR